MRFSYENKNKPRTSVEITVSEDANLTEAFASFVEFTRIAGYLPASWINVLKDVDVDNLTEEYTIYDWALDTLME